MTKGTVHCSTEGNGGSVYCWGLPLRAQLTYSKRSGTGPGWDGVYRSGSLFTFHSFHAPQWLNEKYYPERSHRTPLWALSGLLPLYIAIIIKLSAAALSSAQNSDFPQRKSALNRYWKLLQTRRHFWDSGRSGDYSFMLTGKFMLLWLFWPVNFLINQVYGCIPAWRQILEPGPSKSRKCLLGKTKLFFIIEWLPL